MTSHDGKKPTEHLPYTAEEVDQITSKLYKAIDTLEDRLEKRQLASQHQISASTDGVRSKSIDSATPETIDRHLVASIHTTSIPDDVQLIPNHMESMQEQLNELSEYAYSKISCYQFSIEDILERLQNISNAVQKIDERWTRNDEATRTAFVEDDEVQFLRSSKRLTVAAAAPSSSKKKSKASGSSPSASYDWATVLTNLNTKVFPSTPVLLASDLPSSPRDGTIETPPAHQI
ncbi:hypothetical protein DY000_02060890 [Brassica cretica]|uniref:DUF641 domain-containing protein n=1 Tax=Brassica cretica TaxID=69181 RepID=A0ABQ7ANJ3_BRACR|nr:hypothetical protein DY000_02060890 [Brassica cretica]